jgi:hypothetical protein
MPRVGNAHDIAVRIDDPAMTTELARIADAVGGQRIRTCKNRGDARCGKPCLRRLGAGTARRQQQMHVLQPISLRLVHHPQLRADQETDIRTAYLRWCEIGRGPVVPRCFPHTLFRR